MALMLVAFFLVAFVVTLRRRNLRLGVLALLLMAPAAAQAQIRQPVMSEQWSAWEDLGGAFFKSPACTSSQANRIDCFSVQYGGVVATRQWAQNTWSAWTNVNGVAPEHFTSSRLECLSWGPDHVDCFARRDGDNSVFRRTYQSGYDSGWEALGGVLTTDPSCLSIAVRHLDCFGRGTDGHLYRNNFNGDIWTGWTSLGGQVLDGTKPSCVLFRASIFCITVAANNRLQAYQISSNGAVSITQPPIGNQAQQFTAGGTDQSFRCVVAPGVNPQTDSRINCFAPELAPQPMLGRWIFDGNTWAITDTGVITGGMVSYDFDCVAGGGSRIDCMDFIGRRSNNFAGAPADSITFRHIKLDELPSSNWETPAPPALASGGLPSFMRCTSWGPQRIDCFASGVGLSATHMLHAWMSLQPVRLTLPSGIRH